ncbi:ImmA/IrrE family metallo-endopeptidase [Arthrobacter sp. R-11]|uniref:ImmA/IrrE family metallo-endopeptidase n=1 Tax=Arthrobacter sp. R-11 TaxID=3404053 RepID=UPI003CF31E8B
MHSNVGGFDPWGSLRSLEHVRLSWVDMPDGARGRTNGTDLIWLNRGQQQVERRCALTHELVHLERRDIGCQPATVEAIVNAETARRLIHLDHLAKALAWARAFHELADELWVTPDVLQDRIDHLTEDEWDILLSVELQQP